MVLHCYKLFRMLFLYIHTIKTALVFLPQVYESATSNLEMCKYHPGGPVFHEGLKFWSCCKKKTTDFSEFLAQKGCTTDQHVWKDEKVYIRCSLGIC